MIKRQISLKNLYFLTLYKRNESKVFKNVFGSFILRLGHGSCSNLYKFTINSNGFLKFPSSPKCHLLVVPAWISERPRAE